MSIINKPALLPNMDLFVEESVIKRHLLTLDENPFNRTKLTLKEFEEYNKRDYIKAKLNDFTNKINKWKENYNK